MAKKTRAPKKGTSQRSGSTAGKQRPGEPQEPSFESPSPTDEEIHHRIELRAYERYVARGQREDRALDDWLEAEREILGRSEGGSEP